MEFEKNIVLSSESSLNVNAYIQQKTVEQAKESSVSQPNYIYLNNLSKTDLSSSFINNSYGENRRIRTREDEGCGKKLNHHSFYQQTLAHSINTKQLPVVDLLRVFNSKTTTIKDQDLTSSVSPLSNASSSEYSNSSSSSSSSSSSTASSSSSSSNSMIHNQDFNILSSNRPCSSEQPVVIRQVANVRERQRTESLNEAFEKLRRIVNEKKILIYGYKILTSVGCLKENFKLRKP